MILTCVYSVLITLGGGGNSKWQIIKDIILLDTFWKSKFESIFLFNLKIQKNIQNIIY